MGEGICLKQKTGNRKKCDGCREIREGPRDRIFPARAAPGYGKTARLYRKISTIIAFFIAAILVMPLLFLGACIWFERETARYFSLIAACMTTFPIGRMLERRSWPGSESLGIFKAGAIMVGGVLLVVLFAWIFGSTGILKKQSDYAAEV